MKSFFRRLRLFFCLVSVVLLFSACGNNKVKGGRNSDGKVAMEEIIINPAHTSPFNNGIFEGWGTSFCWWPNRIGYSEILTKKAARLFYNKTEGLGLNIIRFNIGGGDDPSHHHIKRTDSAMPGYLCPQADGSTAYDWNADSSQRNVLMAAINECGDEVVVEAFSNSPPYFMTKSGCSSGAVIKSEDNLRSDQYEAFADYLATVMEHYKTHEGVTFTSVDPLNEPASSYWGAYSEKQEGCHFDQGESQSKMLLAMKAALNKHGLNDVILCGTDETSIDVQIESFKSLSAEAQNAISRIDTHTYMGVGRENLRMLAAEHGKNLWMSEVDGGDVAGAGAGEMGAALWLANRILTDMNGLQPSAWILWQVIDSHISAKGMNGNKDYGRPNLTKGYWGLATADHDNGEILLSKKYYAMAQFSRFIRPGMSVLQGGKNYLSAYDSEQGRLVVVVVNDSPESYITKIYLSLFAESGKNVRVIRTSGSLEGGLNLAELETLAVKHKLLKADLPAASITTFVIDNVRI